MNKNLKNALIAALLVVIQVFLLNNIQLRGMLDAFVAPCIYLMYLLLMPMGTPHVRIQFVAFALGFSVDFLSGTLGINTAACVLLAFLRPSMLKLLNREERNKGTRPSVHLFGWKSFFWYAFTLTFVFHLALCLLEVFTLSDFHLTLLRALLSAAASTVLILMIELIFDKKEKRYR